jgi:hypothetical protein
VPRFLVDSFGLMGDRGYRGCEYVEVCESKEQKGTRQVVEGVNSQIKLFQPSKQVEERDYFTCLPLWLRYRL